MTLEGDRLDWKNHTERMAWQREQRKLTGNAWTKKYEKTPKGFLMRTYRNMKSRVSGIQWRKAHLYKDLSILPREEFYEWALGNPDFWSLFSIWKDSGYSRRLTPSINRIDSNRGYELNNIEWLTHSANSSLGAGSPKRKLVASV